MTKGISSSQPSNVTGLIQPGNDSNLIARGSRLPGVAMIRGFGDFIKNGNIVDLAVAVVIGTAFAALVTQFTESFLTPLIAVTTGGGRWAACSASMARTSPTGRSSERSSPS